MRPRSLPAGLLLVGLLVTPLACSGSHSATPSAAPNAGPVILVTDDDGVGAPGIAALVTKLRTLPHVSVHVVAPATDSSGTDGRTTTGAVRHTSTTTADGYPATAVDGYPADTIRVALDDLGLHPALVVSGVNRGQNIGPIALISGTIGAARAAAQRGIPAIAVSSGRPISGSFDYDVAADYAAREAQKELPGGAASSTGGAATPTSGGAATPTSGGAATPTSGGAATTIVNLNVPSCAVGQVRGLEELPAEITPDIRALGASNCTSTKPPSTEIGSFLDGFAVLTRLPARS